MTWRVSELLTICPETNARAGYGPRIRGLGDLGFDLLDRLDVGFDVHAVTDHHPSPGST